MKIFICTLRRSGSTVFWKTFRENTGFTCYDEPFNPGLSALPKEHKKQVLGEYINLIKKDAQLFWKKYCSISPVEENKAQLSIEQKDYLKFLLDSAEDVVIDTTRCWNKLSSLKEVLEPYPHVFIHLYRDPIAFTSSHLFPSEIKGWRLNKKFKKEFWTKGNDYNYWKMEDVLGKTPGSAFESMVMQNLNLNLSSEQFYRAPAHVKLRLFSHIANAKMNEEGKNLFANQFMSIGFESFCKHPDLFFNLLNELTNIQSKEMNLTQIKQASEGYKSKDPRWNCEFSQMIPKWNKNN
mgnify:CR=1 FL=1